MGTLNGSESEAWDINSSGNIAGTTQLKNSEIDNLERAFKYDTTMRNLGTLGGDQSWGIAINDSNQVVGYSYTATYYMHAFVYGESILDLGTLGGSHSSAYDINDSGNIVGTADTSDGKNHAFLYVNDMMYDLNNLVIPSIEYELGGFVAINDANQIAVSGYYDGKRHTFMLEPLSSAAKGDINNDCKLDLQDAILALQVSAGFNTGPMETAADVDDDDCIGVAEALYILNEM